MLYDRPYMRETSASTPRSMVFWIIGVMVAGFVFQQVMQVWFGSGLLWHYASLTVGGLRAGHAWTVLTYGLMHDGLFHLLVNCLMLFFLGRFLETEIGGKRLLQLSLWGAIGGAAGWTAVNFSRDTTLIGASAVGMAFMTVFTCRQPRRPITLLLFFVLPITILPIWLLAILGGLDLFGLIFQELPGGPSSSVSIAHSAHLGGIAGGWLYHMLVLRRAGGGTAWASSTEIEKPRWFRKAQDTGLSKASYKVEIRSADELRAEVDRILDKINSDGFGSLTAEEKARLDEARDLLSRR